jgi:ATP-binding cassette subfamily C exporter for protease/lipase
MSKGKKNAFFETFPFPDELIFKIPRTEIAHTLAAFKQVLIEVAIFSAIINFLLLVPALYMLQVYDRVLVSRNEATLLMLTLMAVGAYLLMSALELVRTFVLVRIGAQFDMKLNKRVYTASFEQNLKSAGGNAGQSLQDLTNIRQFLTSQGLFAFLDAPWFPVHLFVIFLFSPLLGSFALGGIIVLVALAFVNEMISKKPLADASTMAIASSNLASSNLRNAEVIAAMGMLPNLTSRWLRLHGRFLQLQAEASEKAGIIAAVTKFVRISMQSLILGLGAMLVLQGKITPGVMIVASILMGRALSPVEQLIAGWKNWSSTRSAYERLSTLLEANPPHETRMSLPKPLGELEVEMVTAAPPGATRVVLKNLKFRIEPGDVLGIMGPSGAGKSTLARLLVGIWPSMAGKVRLDKADIYQWNKDELGPHVGYLPQDVELFAGSVSENIARFGEVDAEKVVLAAKRAGVHEMILRLPQGYDSLLGEDGTGLSGGQKQRLGLARALYGDPSLIVLDEPNSNLDEAGELALLAAINDLRNRHKTTVIVTHRRSILETATKLLYLREGATIFGSKEQVKRELARLSQRLVQKAEHEEEHSA